jgi:phenylalanyl-tRNA synthetase beta chain
MMRQLGGGQIAAGYLDDYPVPPPVAEVDLPVEYVNQISGITFTAEQIADILARLEFTCEIVQCGEAVHVVTPPHRLDIDPHDPVTACADLVEEVLRVYGYDNIPNTLIVDELPPQRANTALEREERVRDAMVEVGLREVINYRLTTRGREALLTPPDPTADAARAIPEDASYITLANPTSQDKVDMRRTLLAGLLDVAAANLRFKGRVAIFEVGKVFEPVEGEPLPAEPPRLGILMTGPRALPNWHTGAGAEPEMMDFYTLKGVVEALVAALHLPDVTYTPAKHASFHPGRTASLNAAGESMGVFGQVHPLVCRAYELPEDAVVLAAEFDLEAIQEKMGSERFTITPVSRYEAVYQDIAVVVDAATPAAEVHAEIARAGAPLLREARLFDVYQGEQIPAGKKSLAYALIFQSEKQTLTDKAAAKAQERIVKALSKKFGAALRA